MNNERSTKSGCKNKEIKKLDFLPKIHFLKDLKVLTSVITEWFNYSHAHYQERKTIKRNLLNGVSLRFKGSKISDKNQSEFCQLLLKY